MRVVKRVPNPGEYIIAGKSPERAYIEICLEVKDGFVITTDQLKYPHDLENVWVLEHD